MNRSAGKAISSDWCGRLVLYSIRKAPTAACTAAASGHTFTSSSSSPREGLVEPLHLPRRGRAAGLGMAGNRSSPASPRRLSEGRTKLDSSFRAVTGAIVMPDHERNRALPLQATCPERRSGKASRPANTAGSRAQVERTAGYFMFCVSSHRNGRTAPGEHVRPVPGLASALHPDRENRLTHKGARSSPARSRNQIAVPRTRRTQPLRSPPAGGHFSSGMGRGYLLAGGSTLCSSSQNPNSLRTTR